MSNCWEEEKSFICVKTLWWLKKMLTATLGMFFQAVKGVRRQAVLARPADLHKPVR